MYQKNIDPTQFKTAHAQGLKDPELAKKFGISRATVKRRRAALGLPSNCPNNNRGKLAEQLAADYFRQAGMQVILPANKNAPFDLFVNGWRVEVKLGRRRTNKRGSPDSFEYRLPNLRASYYLEYEYRKDYQADTDFFALVVLDEDDSQLQHLYLMPSKYWQPNITVSPNCPFCHFQQFRNKLHLIPPVAAA